MKRKWAVWKTIVTVIASVVLVAGVTVGGIYLAGGFDKDVVQPQDISFVLDEKLYDTTNGQFEVTKDFSLTITTQTTEFTESKVTLTFNNSDGSHIKEDLVNGTISDGKITVPKTVMINQPFTVRLNKSLLTGTDGNPYLNDKGQQVDWITGGLSVLKATASNLQINPIEVRIAVDVPVYSMSVDVCDMSGNVVSQITEGDHFMAKANYFPASSQFMYSDDLNAAMQTKREKLAFFESKDTTEVTFIYDENGAYFKAGNMSNKNSIVGYTFQSADVQEEVLANFGQTSSGAELYNVVLSYLAAGDTDSVSNKDQPSNVEIVEATISGFTVSQVGQTLDMTAGVKYTLTMNQNDYADGFLGAQVRSTSGEILTSMLRNVAIAFETQDAQGYHPATDLSIHGGKSVVVDGVTYYFANIDVRDYNNAFWELYTAGSYRFRMTVVLLVPNEDTASGYEIYSENNIPVKNTVYLASQAHEEQDVTWAKNEDITMTLDFDGENILPATTMLESYKMVPEQNIFKTVVFFAYFGNSAADPDVVLGPNGYLGAHAGEYTIGTQSYYLYPLDGSELTVADVGDFELFFATVQTQADNSFNYDSNNRYVIVKSTLDSLRVHVTKTLHQGSVTGCNFTTDSNTGFIYEGASDKLNLIFSIEPNSWGVFKEQLAANEIDLRVYDSYNNDISSYFTSEYAIIENDNQVNFTLSINGALNLASDVHLGSVKLSDQFSKKEWAFDHGDFNLTFYTPRVSSITLGSDIVDFDKTIAITQELSAESKFETKILYYVQGQANPTELNDLDRFIQMFKVVVVDQHGNAEMFAEEWTFATDNADAITINGKSFSFKTVDDATAKLYVTCRGTQSTAKLTFHVSSVGIQSMEYDSSKFIHNNAEDAVFVAGGNIGETSVTKYGSAANGKAGEEASYGTIRLHELVRLYTDAGYTQQFTNFRFTFSAQYVYSLNDETILSLFGENGMLYVNWQTDNSHFEFTDATNAETIRKELLSKNGVATIITNIFVRHHFSSDHTMSFVISDNGNTGAVKINLNLTLQANVSISGTSAMNGYAAEALAMKSDLMIEHKAGASESLQEKLKKFVPSEGYTYYIVDDYNGGYILSRDLTKPAIAVGYINADGEFVFYDFWNVNENYYNVTLYLDDVNNPFALSYLVNFTVLRNIQFNIVHNKIYNYLEDQGSVMGDNGFFTYSRISGGTVPETVSFKIELENAEKSYLRFLDSNDHSKFKRNEANPAFFGYNVKTLTQNFIFSIVDGDNIYEIATLPLTFGLGDSFSYQELAKQLYKNSNVDDPAAGKGNQIYQPKVETYEGVDYVFVDKDTWNINSAKGPYTFSLAKTYTLNGVKYTQANYDLPGNAVSFLNNTTSLLGLHDDACYLIVVISSSDNSVIAKSILPLIISNIGTDFVHYSTVSGNDSFNIGKTGVDSLIEQGIYETVSAGQSFVIGTQYDINDKVGTAQVTVAPGFLFPNDSGLTTAIKVVPSVKGYQTNLVKRIWQDSQAPNTWHISLNHLSSEIAEAYVCLRFEISNGSYVEPFFYVLKVLPDTKVNESVYAFNGGSEYISGTVGEIVGGESGINLSETFGEETLHPGQERFTADIYDNDVNKTVYVKELAEETLVTSTFLALDGLGKDYTAMVQQGKDYYLKNSEGLYGVAYHFTAGSELYTRTGADQYNLTDVVLEQDYTVFKTAFSGDYVAVEQDNVTYYLKAQAVSSVGATYYFEAGSNLYKDTDKNLGRALQFTYQVVSVSVESQVLTKEEEYASYLEISFSEDGRMMLRPKKDSTMTILLQRVYSGAAQDEALSIVGGVTEYQFVLNSTVNYSLQFENKTTADDSVTANGNEGDWTVLAADTPWDEEEFTSFTKDEQTFYLKNNTSNQKTQYSFPANTIMYSFDGTNYIDSGLKLTRTFVANELGENYTVYNNGLADYYLFNEDSQPLKTSESKYLFSQGSILYLDTEFKQPSVLRLEFDYVTSVTGSYTAYSLNGDTYYLKNSLAKPCYSFDVGTEYYAAAGDSIPVGTLTEVYTVVPQIQMSVKLLSTAVSGDSSTSSVVYGKLKATWRADSGSKDISDIVSSVSYDNMTGILSLTRTPYLDRDRTIIGSFYTDYGYLGTLTIHVGASVAVTLTNTEVTAGSNLALMNRIGTVTLNGEVVSKEKVSVTNIDTHGSEFVAYSGYDGLTVYSNSADRSVSLTVTIKVNGNAYTFDMPLHISKNVTQKQDNSLEVGRTNETAERITHATATVAGNKLTLGANDLFTVKNSLNFQPKYTWEAVSGGAYIKDETVPQNAIQIETKNVGELGVNVVVMITIGLYHAQSDTIPYDTFKVRYTFNIVANTSITVHYPNPSNTSDGELSAEYLANNATFDLAKDNFFEKSALFNNQNRVVVTEKEDSAAGINYSVDLYQIQNASISYQRTGETIFLSIEDGYNHLIKPATDGSAAINIQSMQFHMGVWDGSDYINDGTECSVTFLITCNGVSAYYKVILQEKVLSLSINQVNVDANKVETFYVEDLAGDNNDSKIFADSRLISFTVASVNENANIGAIVEADYRIVLKSGSNYKVLPVRLSKNDIAKRKYFDLGKSYLGYDYLGTYVNNAENFDASGTFLPASAKAILDSSLYSLVDMPHFASRIEMTYHDLPIAYKYLDNLTFASHYTGASVPGKVVKDYVPEPNSSQIDQTVDLSNFIFEMKNGQSDVMGFAEGNSAPAGSVQFSSTYSYLTTVDIAVENNVLVNGNFESHVTELYVNQEIQSLIADANIYHPSTKANLSDADLTSGGMSINLHIVGVDISDTVLPDNIKTQMQAAYGDDIFTPYYGGNTNNKYLAISVVQPGEHVLDYRITGFGAGNSGNYALLYLEYKVKVGEVTYTKNFGLVYKVLPDYQIQYVNTTIQDTDKDGVVSNESNPYVIYVASADNASYDKIQIAGGTSANRIVTVRHQNGNNTEKDVSASGFTYTLPYDILSASNLSYNIESNVSTKMKESLTNAGWGSITSPVAGYRWSNSRDDASLALSGINKVLFGSQSYMLEAVDQYGYQFKVYFTLSSSGDNPAVVESNLSITEGKSFDIGAVYNSLEIATVGSDKIDIIPTSNTNPSTPNHRMINIANLEAWGYVKDYASTEVEGETPYLTKSGDKAYRANEPTYKAFEEDEIYLARPNFADVRVTGINWYKAGQVEPVATKTYAFDTAAKLATRTGLTFNGLTSTGDYRDATETYEMPKLTGDAYGASSSVELTMVISLTYKVSSVSGKVQNEEVYNLSTPITVYRDYTFTSKKNNIVQDGAEFKISDYISVNSQSGVPENINYLDDTMQITLPEFSTITYSITTVGSDVNENKFTLTNTYGYPRTFYVSISNVLGMTPDTGANLRFTILKNVTSQIENYPYYGYYIQYNNNKIVTMVKDETGTIKPVTIVKNSTGESYTDLGTVTSVDGKESYPSFEFAIVSMNGVDSIRIVNSIQLANDLTAVTKYYLAALTVNGNNYNYQVAQTYNVSGYYHSLNMNYAGSYKSVDRYLKVEKGYATNDKYIAPLAGWTDGMTLNYAVQENVLVGVACDEFNDVATGKIYFKMSDVSSSGAAKINEKGQITTTESYHIASQYLNISIYMKTSGLNGDWAIESANDKLLGTARIMLDQNANADFKITVPESKTMFDLNTTFVGFRNKVDGAHYNENITIEGVAGKTIYASMQNAILGKGEQVTFYKEASEEASIFYPVNSDVNFRIDKNTLSTQYRFASTTPVFTKSGDVYSRYTDNAGNNMTIQDLGLAPIVTATEPAGTSYPLTENGITTTFDMYAYTDQTSGITYYIATHQQVTGGTKTANYQAEYILQKETDLKTIQPYDDIPRIEEGPLKEGNKRDFIVNDDGSGWDEYMLGGVNYYLLRKNVSSVYRQLYVPLGDFGVTYTIR